MGPEPGRGEERSNIMRMEKKRILKEDGRYLVYYHFPDSAGPEETQVYADIDPAVAEAGHGADAPTKPTAEERPHV